jgi:hypothetical protein
MCGDIEDDTLADDELFQRLLALARRYNAVPVAGRPDPGLVDAAARHAYMSTLFRDTLTRSISDAAAFPEGQRADALASQAIVLARLAGFLAGQLPPEADLFRSMIEAMTDGHGEPERRRAEVLDHVVTQHR